MFTLVTYRYLKLSVLWLHMQLPGDGLCKPKHFGATIIIFV